MSSELGKIIADFRTSLAVKMAVGATTGTLQSATDDDSVALPAGTYYFTVDGDNSQKEHIKCSLSGTALTSVYSVSRQGVKTSGAAREHRIGASVTITNFAHLKEVADLIAGTTDLNASDPLKYDGVAALTPGSNQLATVAYADALTFAGAPDSNTTQKGIVEQATNAETKAGTATGGTAAKLFATPADIADAIQSGSWVYAADSVGTDAYAITPTPAISAYAAGQKFLVKVATVNTGAATFAVSGLAAKAIKKFHDQALEDGDIEANSIIELAYDAVADTFQLLTPVASSLLQANITNTEANTLTAGATSNADSLHTHSFSRRITNFYNTTVAGDAAETNLFSVTLPGGSMSTNNIIALHVWITNLDILAAGATDGITFNLKYGGSTVFSLVYENTNAGAFTGFIGTIRINMVGNGATGSQAYNSQTLITKSDNDFSGAVDTYIAHQQVGTSSVDSTADQTLSFSIDWEGASATNTITCSGYVELID
jgi:hypothetical protein